VKRASRHVARQAFAVAVVAAVARRVVRKKRVGGCVCRSEDSSILSDDSVWW